MPRMTAIASVGPAYRSADRRLPVGSGSLAADDLAKPRSGGLGRVGRQRVERKELGGRDLEIRKLQRPLSLPRPADEEGYVIARVSVSVAIDSEEIRRA